MATKKQPDSEGGTLPEHADLWFAQFLKHLEISLIEEGQQLPAVASPKDYAMVSLRAVTSTLMEADSNLGPEEVLGLLSRVLSEGTHPANTLTWTPELNARRFLLIDQEIQGRLSSAERFELASLTRAMRDHVDSEANLSFEGAQKLHEFLMDSASPPSDEQH